MGGATTALLILVVIGMLVRHRPLPTAGSEASSPAVPRTPMPSPAAPPPGMSQPGMSPPAMSPPAMSSPAVVRPNPAGSSPGLPRSPRY